MLEMLSVRESLQDKWKDEKMYGNINIIEKMQRCMETSMLLIVTF